MPASLLLVTALWFQGEPISLGPHAGDGDAVLVHPTDDSLILAGEGKAGLLRSTDGGLTFDEFGVGLPTLGNFIGLWPDPKDVDTVYVIADQVLYRSTDFGANWTALVTPGIGFGDLLISSATDTLFVYGNSAIHRSTDGGATWSQVFTGSGISDVDISHTNPQRLFCVTNTGVLRSDDGGTSFLPTAYTLSPEGIAVSPFDEDVVVFGEPNAVYRSDDGLGTYQQVAPISLFLSPEFFRWSIQNGDVWLVLNNALWRSTDGGLTWFTDDAGIDPLPRARRFSFDSFGNAWMAADSTNGGLFRYDIGAATWSKKGFSNVAITDVTRVGDVRLAVSGGNAFSGQTEGTLELLYPPTSYASAVAVDPADPSRWLVGGAFNIDDSTIHVVTDYGVSQTLAHLGYIDGDIADFEFVESDPGVVLAAKSASFASQTITRSTDSGASWTGVGGTGFWDLEDLASDPHTPGRVFALEWGGDVAESLDAGATWGPMTTTAPGADQAAFFRVDPHRPLVRYHGSVLGGLQRSADGGATWQVLGPGLTSRSDIAFSEAISGLMWVSDDAGNVLVSADRGDTFEVAFDPPGDGLVRGLAYDLAANALLIGTESRGVWELPDASPYVVLAGGTAGSGGIEPVLAPLFELPKVGATGWGFFCSDGVGGAPAVLGLGLSALGAPLVGGIVHPGPPFVAQLPITLGGSPGAPGDGTAVLPLAIPANPALAGVTVNAQLAVIGDAGAADPSGIVLSDGLATTLWP